MAKLQPQLQLQVFDVFIHAFYPAAGHASGKDCTIQLWVWVSSGSGPYEASWKPVSAGYVCPGPGSLEGRHLMITNNGVPTWITGSTRYRRYKAGNPPTVPNEQPRGYHVNEPATFEGMGIFQSGMNVAKVACKADYYNKALRAYLVCYGIRHIFTIGNGFA
jgi:hypothetical protein